MLKGAELLAVTGVTQGGSWAAGEFMPQGGDCSDKCCQMRAAYRNSCNALATMDKMRDQFDVWRVQLCSGKGQAAREEISKGLAEMQTNLDRMKANMKFRRGRLVMLLGVEAVLLVLLVLYAYFFIMRRAGEAKSQLEELQDEVAALKSHAGHGPKP